MTEGSHWDMEGHPDCEKCPTYEQHGFGAQACGPCMDEAMTQTAIERAFAKTESCEHHGFRSDCNQCMANFAAMLYKEGVDSDLGFEWLHSW